MDAATLADTCHHPPKPLTPLVIPPLMSGRPPQLGGRGQRQRLLKVTETTPPVVLARALLTHTVTRHKEHSRNASKPRQPHLRGCVRVAYRRGGGKSGTAPHRRKNLISTDNREKEPEDSTAPNVAAKGVRRCWSCTLCRRKSAQRRQRAASVRHLQTLRKHASLGGGGGSLDKYCPGPFAKPSRGLRPCTGSVTGAPALPSASFHSHPPLPCRGGPLKTRPPQTPLASGRETGSQSQSAPHQRPLSNTRPPHHRNSVGTCCVPRVAQ